MACDVKIVKMIQSIKVIAQLHHLPSAARITKSNL